MRLATLVSSSSSRPHALVIACEWLVLLALVMLFSLEAAAATPPPVLRILQTLPQGALKKAEDANEIRIQFDRPVIALAAIAERPAMEQFVKIEPPLPGDFHWGSTRLLIFTPKPLPPLSSHFTVTISGIKAMDGSAIQEPRRFWFETPRIMCQANLAYQGARYESKAELHVNCDQPVAVELLARHLKLNFFTLHHPEGVAHAEPSPADWKKMIAADPAGAAKLRALIDQYRAPAKLLSTPALSLLPPVSNCNGSAPCYRFSVSGNIPRDSEAVVEFTDGIISKSGHLPSHTIPASREKTFQTKLMMYDKCNSLCNPENLHGFRLYDSESQRSYYDGYGYNTKNDPERYDGRIQIADLTVSGPPQVYHAPPTEKENGEAERRVENHPLSFQWAVFIPRHTYEIRFTPQTADAKKLDGQTLDYTSITTLTMANAPAYAVIRTGESVLESPVRGFGIYLRNVTKLETAVTRIDKAGLIDAIRSFPHSPDDWWFNAQHWKSVTLPDTTNVATTRVLPTDALVGKGGHGVFSLAVRADEVTPLSLYCNGALTTTNPRATDCREYSAYRSGALVQVTDLAVTLRWTPVNILVSVTSIATGKPVAGATVSLYLNGNSSFWSGKTDQSGLSLAPSPAHAYQTVHWGYGTLIAIAANEDDLAYTDARWSRGSYWSSSSGWSNYAYDYSDDHNRVNRITGEFITDRGVYRPGETVHFKALIREQQPRRLGIAANIDPVKFTLSGPDGEPVHEELFTASPGGAFDGSFIIPADGKQGDYSLRAQATSAKSRGEFFAKILVTAYRRPEFKVDLTANHAEYKAGEIAAIKIAGEYLYGAPMVGRETNWSLRLRHHDFDPTEGHPELGLKGFSFALLCNRDWRNWNSDCLIRTRDETEKPEPVTEESEADDRVLTGELWRMLENDRNSVSRDGIKLDDKGNLTITAPIPVITRPHHAFSMEFEGTVIDVNEQQISGRKEVIVHPGDFYLGLKLEKRFVERSEAVKLSAVALTPEGKWHPGVQVKASVGNWESVTDEKSKEVRYLWKPLDQVQFTAEAKTREITFKPLPPAIYLVRLEATDTRGNTLEADAELYITGNGFTGWWWENEKEEIKLIPEREVYQSGETARILVQSPWAEAEGLLTIERDEVISTRRFHLDSAAYLLEVPLTAVEIPNVHLNVILFKGRTSFPKTGESEDFGAPDIKSGGIEIKVAPNEKKLKLKITPNQTTARPGALSSVTVEVRDAKGKPAPGEITLWAVDEGLLRMSDYKIPDLLTDLYGQRPHYVTMGDSRLRLIPLAQLDPKKFISLYDNKNASVSGATGLENQYIIGGVNITNSGYGGIGAYDSVRGADMTRINLSDAISSFPRGREFTSAFDFAPGVNLNSGLGGHNRPQEKIAIRTDFRILATWIATLKTDANGRAVTQFRLPESLTNYKILAIAASGPDQFGDGESAVTLNKPFMILPSMPRFLNLGDTVEGSVVLQNQTGKAGAAGLRINLPKDSPLELLDPVERQLNLPVGPTELRIKFKAARLGTAQFNLTATLLSGGQLEKDGVRVEFPVSITRRMETVAAAGMAEPQSMERLKLPADVYPDLGGFSASLSSTALTGLQHGLEYLVEYPYGCLEQRSSRIKVLLMIKDLQGAFPLPQFKIQDLGALVQGELDQIAAYQTVDGGLTYWKGGDHPSLFLTARMLEILTDAEKLGFRVSPDLKNKIVGYLKNQVDRWRNRSENADDRWLDETAILSALAHAGEGDKQENDFVATHFDSLSPFEQTLLLKARVESNQQDALTVQLKTELMNHVRIEADQAFMQNESGGWSGWYWGRYPHYAFLYANDTHETAALLSTLLAIDPQEPLAPLMARWLLQRRKDGHWGNTFADGYALTSLVEYYRAQESVTPDFKGSVTLGSSSLFAQQFKGRELEPRAFSQPMAQLAKTFQEYAATPEGLPLIFKAEGQGRMYYTARLQYAPKLENLPPVDAGFTVTREYLPYVKLHDLGSGDEQEVPQSLNYKAGDLVRVRLRIDTRQVRHNVVIEDPLPAGLEALDAALATTSREQLRQADASPQHNGNEGWWGWTGIDHTEIKDDRVLLFATRLQPGVLEYTYIARATSTGLFIAPPTQAEEMYRPEIFGRGSVVKLVINTPADQAPATRMP